MFRDLLSVLQPGISGRRAWDDAAAIHSIDRRFTFPAFQESARYSADQMRAAGLSEVTILQAPADGRTLYGDWMMPLAWDASAATFDLIPPRGRPERIADRAATPCCLAMWSSPTPTKGIEADLVLVDNPAEAASEDVRGKIVFTSANPHRVKRLLLERGALGFLSDIRWPDAPAEAVAWINAWSDDPGGWAFTAADSPAWAFLISTEQGARIRARFAAGEKLRGRAFVNASLYEATLPLVTGVIQGSTREEVVLLGHQFEQGALDNASGIGVMLEAARALQSLISEGRLAPPKRSIRLLFVSECYTTMYWVEGSPSSRRAAAALCIDAACGLPSLATGPLEISVNPHSQMSCGDALVLALVRQVMAAAPTYPWSEIPFAMGTDNLLADQTIGMPCPWIGSHSRTWHNSADVPDTVDPRLQELVALISAAYVYLLAGADSDLVSDFAYLAAARGKAALALAAVAELDRLAEADLDDSLQQISYLAERHAGAIATALGLLPPTERAALRSSVRDLQRDLRRSARDEAASLARRAGRPGYLPPAHDLDGALSTIRPRRLIRGQVTFDRLAPEARQGKGSPRWSAELFAVLNWCDGRRSLAEACELAARSLRRDRTLSAEDLAKAIDPTCDSMQSYFDFLRQHGYVTW